MKRWMNGFFFLEIFYNVTKTAFCWAICALTFGRTFFQQSWLLHYYFEPYIHSFPWFLCVSQFPASHLESMIINYVLILKIAPPWPSIFLWVSSLFSMSLLIFYYFFCEAKSMSPLFSFYLLTSSLCKCLFFHFALTIFSHCLQIVYGRNHCFIQVASKCKYSSRKITEWQGKIMLWNKHCIFNWFPNQHQLNKCLIAVLRETN